MRFSGTPDSRGFEEELQLVAKALRVDKRVQWLGQVTEADKRTLYANCLGVLYPPVDEDFGYVTLEAMLSSKPVITCSDSSGPLEFIRHEETGLVAAPEPEAIARNLDRLWMNREEAANLGAAARLSYERMNISWASVLDKLLSSR